jgi:NurA-like 5'-3' nuclease
MAEKSTKKYLSGSGKVTKFNNGGTIINLSVKLADLNALSKYPSKGGDDYVRISVSLKEEPDQYGNEVSIYENDYKPNKDGGAGKAAPAKSTAKPKAETDDMPF